MWAARQGLVLLLGLLTVAHGARAERADRDQPIQIEADSARMDDIQKLAVYEGKVVLRQGTLWLSAERVEVRQDAAGFTLGLATGSPVQFRQKLEGRDEFVQGWAQRLEYDARQENVRLTGDARLKKGEEELQGDLITYNAKSELFQASGGGASQGKGRVRAVILPKANAARPADDAKVSPGK